RICELALDANGHRVPITLAAAETGAAPPDTAKTDADVGRTVTDADVRGMVTDTPLLPEVPSTMVAPPMAMRRHGDQTSLNPTFTFATFVSGKANQLARAAGM